MSAENIGKVGSESKGVRYFFMMMVQAVLILGADTWVMTPRMGRALGGVTKKGISIDHWEKSPEVIGCKTGISIAGDGNSAY